VELPFRASPLETGGLARTHRPEYGKVYLETMEKGYRMGVEVDPDR